jgi:hypothetical protein
MNNIDSISQNNIEVTKETKCYSPLFADSAYRSIRLPELPGEAQSKWQWAGYTAAQRTD